VRRKTRSKMSSSVTATAVTTMTSEEEIEMLRCLKGHVIKTYKNGKFTDVTLKSKDAVEIKAHKLILYAQNAWFARKLESMPDSDVISLDNFRGEILKTVIDTIYYRKMSPMILSKENVLEYLKAGEMFYIDSIRDEAALYMTKNLDMSYAMDMIKKPVFQGSMADMAYDYIASNFQILLKEKKLKERMLSELPAHKLTRILGSRNLMLWDENGAYLGAADREKQLLFLVLGYVAQEKESRLPEFKKMMRALKVSLLVVKKLINMMALGAGFKVPPEEVSGMIADVVEPFEDVKTDLNLATLTQKDKKRSKSEAKDIADMCQMRFGTIPHNCYCSELALKVEPWSQISLSKLQYAPGPADPSTAVCSAPLRSITVYLDKLVTPEVNQENGTTETEKKGEDAEEKSESTTAEEPKPEAAKKVDEWRVCGIKLVDSKKKEQSVGVLEGDNVKSSTYELEKGEFITEILGLFNKDKVAGLEGRGKHRKEMLAQEMLSLTSVEDLGFRTNKGRSFGPTGEKKKEEKKDDKKDEEKKKNGEEVKQNGKEEEGDVNTKIGVFYRLPKQIMRLENGAPNNFWWLQGFGLEKVKLGEEEEKIKFYPIWKFHSAHKYYPLDYEGIEFVGGVKKHMQFSIDGLEECLDLKTIQDLESVEKTPVHEVVDLDDSEEEEAEPAEDGEEENTSTNQNDAEGENEDSVMIVDSDDGGGGDREEEEDDEEEEGEEEEEDEYQQGMLSHEVFGAQYSNARMGGGAAEPIEIPSSSDEDDSEKQSNGSSGKKRKGSGSDAGTPKKKK